MSDEKEMADARTMEEDMETSNNMSWLNKQVVELEAEVKRLQGILDDYRRFHTWISEKNYDLIAEWDALHPTTYPYTMESEQE